MRARVLVALLFVGASTQDFSFASFRNCDVGVLVLGAIAQDDVEVDVSDAAPSEKAQVDVYDAVIAGRCLPLTCVKSVDAAFSGEGFSDEERQTLKEAQKFSFQAEVNRMMDILINALYSKREVFLRELVSNSADVRASCQFSHLSNSAAGLR
jgi:hypothetical protein